MSACHHQRIVTDGIGPTIQSRVIFHHGHEVLSLDGFIGPRTPGICIQDTIIVNVLGTHGPLIEFRVEVFDARIGFDVVIVTGRSVCFFHFLQKIQRFVTGMPRTTLGECRQDRRISCRCRPHPQGGLLLHGPEDLQGPFGGLRSVLAGNLCPTVNDRRDRHGIRLVLGRHHLVQNGLGPFRFPRPAEGIHQSRVSQLVRLEPCVDHLVEDCLGLIGTACIATLGPALNDGGVGIDVGSHVHVPCLRQLFHNGEQILGALGRHFG
mmetsp:Transcript_6403/g.13629  ORF Transcript_6403/g.13629 Transcript_6403/m.13629 type:complete len:265 (-) Transcript_6403:1123-1917(-)